MNSHLYVSVAVIVEGVGGGGFHTNPNIAPIKASMNPIMNPLHRNKLSIDSISATIDQVLTVDGSPEFIFIEAIISNIPNMRPIDPRAIINVATCGNGAIVAAIAAATVDRAKSIIPFSNISIPPINTNINAVVGLSPIITPSRILFRHTYN